MQVSYFYDSELGDFYYGPHHPMKPHRVRMAHDLIVRYGLYSHLQVGVTGRCRHTSKQSLAKPGS
jgi:histone deacetylase 1/2